MVCKNFQTMVNSFLKGKLENFEIGGYRKIDPEILFAIDTIKSNNFEHRRLKRVLCQEFMEFDSFTIIPLGKIKYHVVVELTQ